MAAAAEVVGNAWEKDYEPGDVIIDYCEPFVKCLMPTLRDVRCTNCFAKLSSNTTCNGCHEVSYCCKKCQVEDWHAGHKAECKMFKDKEFVEFLNMDSTSENKFLALRIYCMRRILPGVSDKPYPMWDGTTSSLHRMPYFMGNDEVQQAKMLVCNDMAMFLNRYRDLTKERRVNADDLVRWLGVMIFAILAEDDTSRIGCGIYVEAGNLRHHCKPTATYVNTGLKLQLRVIGRIRKGERPTISFVKGNLDNKVRRITILRQFGFDCPCNMCESGDRIDYAELNALNEQIGQLRDRKLDRQEWGTFYKAQNKVLNMYFKIYHQYDERITHLVKWSFDVAKATGIHRVQLQIERDCAREWLLITYGKDHPYFKTFALFADR